MESGKDTGTLHILLGFHYSLPTAPSTGADILMWMFGHNMRLWFWLYFSAATQNICVSQAHLVLWRWFIPDVILLFVILGWSVPTARHASTNTGNTRLSGYRCSWCYSYPLTLLWQLGWIRYANCFLAIKFLTLIHWSLLIGSKWKIKTKLTLFLHLSLPKRMFFYSNENLIHFFLQKRISSLNLSNSTFCVTLLSSLSTMLLQKWKKIWSYLVIWFIMCLSVLNSINIGNTYLLKYQM